MQLTHPLEISLPGVVSEPSVQDDAQLVKASQHGDQHAFAILVQRHQRRVFTMVLRMLQDYEEASEITQEAFLAAWQGLPSFRGEARFATWLYRIAYHCALKQLERRKRERSLQAAMEAEQILEEVNEEKQAEDMLELCSRQAMVRELLSPHVLNQHPNALSAWIGVPKHWQLDSLVRELRHRHVAVTAPDPFLVHGSARPEAFRLCVGAEADDARVRSAIGTIAEVFEQYPKLNDFI